MPVNEGEVEIVLAGKTVVLRCTLRAAKTVNAHFDGFMGALRALSGLNLDTCSMIVAAGLGKKQSEVEEAVYETGIADLVAPLTLFIEKMVHGGRNAGAEANDGKGEE